MIAVKHCDDRLGCTAPVYQSVQQSPFMARRASLMNLTTVAIQWSSSFMLFADHGDDNDNECCFAIFLWIHILTFFAARQQNMIVMIVIFITIITSIKKGDV